MFLVSTVLLLGLSLGSAQNPGCDFYQQISPGNRYTINSPGWPYNYGPFLQCRWIADCPTGYRCRLTCSEINMPYTTSCAADRLMVSLSGNPNLNDAQNYCGQGTLNVLSTGTRLSMGLISAPSSTGGRFTCQLSAEASAPTPTCRCGDRRMTRIVGGQATGVNEFPSMVGIVDVRISTISCGGVILSPYYVLSAAHCTTGENPANFAVIVGEHDITVGDSPATQAYRITSFLNHPWFTESNYDYDVSIITVANPIVFSDLVGPICLPFKFRNWDFSGAIVTLLGWGTLFPGGPTSNTLQKVDVNVLSQNTCLARVPVTNRQMCTFTPGKDSCQNDSGGPVLYTDPSTSRLFSAGIISYGYNLCASDSPGINTRVTSVLDWIVQSTPGANYCQV